MKKHIIAVCCFLGALSLYSCNSSSSNEAQTGESGTPVVASDSTLTDDKKELMAFAARNNMLQIELGKMATQKGSSDEVKQYGQQLVDWYTNKQQELQDLAQQFSVTLPQQLGDDQRDYVADIQKADANEFDQKYWDSVVDSQKEAIDEYDDNLKDVAEASGNAFSIWARNTLKELRAQMEQASAYQFQRNTDQS